MKKEVCTAKIGYARSFQENYSKPSADIATALEDDLIVSAAT
ncbi:MAG: hypothetical protein QM706_18025 [Nitrospira sp.]